MTSRSTTLAAALPPGSAAVRTSWTAAMVTMVAIAMAAEAAAGQILRPLRDTVRDADVIVQGKVTGREPIDERSDVVVVKAATVLKGDVPEKAAICLVIPGGRPVTNGDGSVTNGGGRVYIKLKVGDEGIWLVKKNRDRDAYTPLDDSPLPLAAALVIELLVAGKTDAGAAMPQILREADGRVRQVALEEVCGPRARVAALPILLEWAGSPLKRDDTSVRSLAIQQLVKACDENERGVAPRAMKVLDGILAREPEKTEDTSVFAEACNAAGTIASKHLGFKAGAGTSTFVFSDFISLESRYFAGLSPEARQAAVLRHEQARAAVQALRAWWAERPGDRP